MSDLGIKNVCGLTCLKGRANSRREEEENEDERGKKKKERGRQERN